MAYYNWDSLLAEYGIAYSERVHEISNYIIYNSTLDDSSERPPCYTGVVDMARRKYPDLTFDQACTLVAFSRLRLIGDCVFVERPESEEEGRYLLRALVEFVRQKEGVPKEWDYSAFDFFFNSYGAAMDAVLAYEFEYALKQVEPVQNANYADAARALRQKFHLPKRQLRLLLAAARLYLWDRRYFSAEYLSDPIQKDEARYLFDGFYHASSVWLRALPDAERDYNYSVLQNPIHVPNVDAIVPYINGLTWRGYEVQGRDVEACPTGYKARAYIHPFASHRRLSFVVDPDFPTDFRRPPAEFEFADGVTPILERQRLERLYNLYRSFDYAIGLLADGSEKQALREEQLALLHADKAYIDGRIEARRAALEAHQWDKERLEIEQQILDELCLVALDAKDNGRK